MDELRATQAHAEKVIVSARAGTLDCDAVGELYAGWVLHIPGPALLDLLTKLHQREARDVMIYFDGLSRLAELEKRYGATHAKLVELTSKISDKCYQTQILETASQLHGYLETLLVVGSHFLSEAGKLRRHAMMSGCRPIFISGG